MSVHDKGEGVKESDNFVDVINGSPKPDSSAPAPCRCARAIYAPRSAYANLAHRRCDEEFPGQR